MRALVFNNFRKFLRYMLSSNMVEIFTVFESSVFAGLLGISQSGSLGVAPPPSFSGSTS